MRSGAEDNHIDHVLNGMDFNDDHMNVNYESDHSGSKTLESPTHTGERPTRTATSDLEALKRTLVERKILLCNLQIEIARKQLETLDKPSPTDA